MRQEIKKYLPGLNGIRSLAAIFILLGHIPQKDFVCWDVVKLPVPGLCAYLFFVLSGFLAGYRADKMTSAKQYYKSKAKRILPAYFLCIATVLVASILCGNVEEFIDKKLIYYMLLLPNIPFSSSTGILPLVHLWFVGVMALFYLSIPLVIKASKRIGGKADVFLPSIIIVGWSFLKWGLYLLCGKDNMPYRFVSCTAFDIIYLGFLSGVLFNKDSKVTNSIANNKVLDIISWILFLSFAFWGTFIPAPARTEVFAVISVILVLEQLGKTVIISLENSFFNWLGNISYEIYIFQIPVIIGLSNLYKRFGLELSSIAIYISCLISVLVIAQIANTVINYIIYRRIRSK